MACTRVVHDMQALSPVMCFICTNFHPGGDYEPGTLATPSPGCKATLEVSIRRGVFPGPAVQSFCHFHRLETHLATG